MEIQELFHVNTYVSDNKLIYSFVYNNCDITDLRVMKTIESVKAILDTLYLDEVKNVCFVFIIDRITIPTNYILFKEFANTFKKYFDVIDAKLKFSIVQSSSNIFQMFFSTFKKFYEPIKPLYLCADEIETKHCIASKIKRAKFPNISSLLLD